MIKKGSFVAESMAAPVHLFWAGLWVHAKSLQPYRTLCNPTDCSLTGSSGHGILQTRRLEWVAMPSSVGFSWPRDQSPVLCLLHWQVGSLPLEPPVKPLWAGSLTSDLYWASRTSAWRVPPATLAPSATIWGLWGLPGGGPSHSTAGHPPGPSREISN